MEIRNESARRLRWVIVRGDSVGKKIVIGWVGTVDSAFPLAGPTNRLPLFVPLFFAPLLGVISIKNCTAKGCTTFTPIPLGSFQKGSQLYSKEWAQSSFYSIFLQHFSPSMTDWRVFCPKTVKLNCLCRTLWQCPRMIRDEWRRFESMPPFMAVLTVNGNPRNHWLCTR